VFVKFLGDTELGTSQRPCHVNSSETLYICAYKVLGESVSKKIINIKSDTSSVLVERYQLHVGTDEQ
jgi:hypothetical protein